MHGFQTDTDKSDQGKFAETEDDSKYSYTSTNSSRDNLDNLFGLDETFSDYSDNTDDS